MMLFYCTECHYAECRILFTIMLIVIMLSAVMLNAIMLSVAAPAHDAPEKECQMCELSRVWAIYFINVCEIDMTSIDDTIDTKKEIPEVYSSTNTCFNKPGNQAF
jgi:hypothetical protein